MKIDFWVENRRNMATGPFTVKLSYVRNSGTYLIGTEAIGDIDALSDKTVSFNWDIDGYTEGLYNLTVEIIASNDINPANDILTYSNVTIRIPGDTDVDGDVDFDDFVLFNGVYPGGYNWDADLDHSGGGIDFDDFVLFNGYYPRTSVYTYTY